MDHEGRRLASRSACDVVWDLEVHAFGGLGVNRYSVALSADGCIAFTR
jgi:hypothetical protein